MRRRRFTSFLIGLWLGSGLLMAWIAIDSFRSVDRMLASPSAAAELEIKKIGPAARALFRYQVAEQNGAWFEQWEWVQLIYGALLFMYLLFGTKLGKLPLAAVLVMLAIVAAQRFIVTPELSALRGMFDFAAPTMAKGARVKFLLLHSGYVSAESLKLVIGMVLAIGLARSGRAGSADTGEQINLVDKANYRHVNR
jgi:hypothetical protein